MSHPNGEQADPGYQPTATGQAETGYASTGNAATSHATTSHATTSHAATGQAPGSFQEPATRFTASNATVPATPAYAGDAPQSAAMTPGMDTATQPAYTPSPVAPGVAPATQPAYAPGTAMVPAAAPAGDVPAVVGANPYLPEGTSAFPVTGVPVSGYPMVMEPKKKRTGTIMLTVATIVLGLAAAGLGTMYFLEADARGKADKKVSEQTALLEDADKKLKETESKLSTSKEENAKLTQDLTGAKNKTDEVTKARDALAGCMQASEAYAASKNANTAKDLIVKCAEAEKYY